MGTQRGTGKSCGKHRPNLSARSAGTPGARTRGAGETGQGGWGNALLTALESGDCQLPGRIVVLLRLRGE
jgi:hypothetical protein